MVDPFKNLQVNLRAAGPAAVLCMLFITIGCVGVFGHGPIASQAMTILALAIGVVGGSLAMRS